MEITDGIACIAQATIINGLRQAKEILKEIQNEYDYLDVFDEKDPGDLHIYEVGAVKEIV